MKVYPEYTDELSETIMMYLTQSPLALIWTRAKTTSRHYYGHQCNFSSEEPKSAKEALEKNK